MMNLKKTIIIGLMGFMIGLLFPVPGFASVTSEDYCVDTTAIPSKVLQEAIGRLAVDCGKKEGTKLTTYQKAGDKFIPADSLLIKKTVPITKFGYHAIEEMEDTYGTDFYNYFITAKIGSYVCLVYDPIKDLEAWINIEDIDPESYNLVIFDMMPDSNSAGYFVDLGYLLANFRPKVYKLPDEHSMLVKPKYGEYLVITGQKNGFIQIANYDLNPDTNRETIKPLRWIKMRDNEGRIVFWLYTFSEFY